MLRSLLFLPSLCACIIILNPGWKGIEGRVHIPDDLDDVVDEEEDESWRQWGKQRSSLQEFDPPPDFDGMDPSQIEQELMKRHFGPIHGFIKLRLGVRRSEEDIPAISTKWAKIIRTASLEAKFSGIDLNTIMFHMERGQDVEEFKDFILSQPEAYEVKIGAKAFRRPADPPLEEVISMLKKQKAEAIDDLDSSLESDTIQQKNEL